MKKIVYIMNVDWNWIKQRPHFIAERLAKDYDVKIVYQYRYNRSKLQKRGCEGLNLKPVYVIPKLSSIEKLSWINDFILSKTIKKIIRKEKPDIVFTTYPTHINLIPDSFEGKVIYDCMDNHFAFVDNEKKKHNIEDCEKKLIDRANQIIVSSEYLMVHISQRYGTNLDNFYLVRNAYNGEIIELSQNKEKNDAFKMAYVGTISSWFDWKTIEMVLQEKKDVELHLYGPIDNTEIMKHERVIYHGTIEHEKLFETIKDMDALIMPFLINEIIEAVDPVKLYEYINFNKNIIMCKYKEVERFDEFVYFYNNVIEFVEAIEKIRDDNSIKYSNSQRLEFLMNNNWKNRVNQIIELMEK